ncbi:MAG: TIGR00282 family metallophosphoesterase [Oscillospiraceae bacterium]|nr:TIGR00282 family metallophosphoesterase [Oscillospiraceae bacterium]
MKILMFGDVVGQIGCNCLGRNLAKLRRQYNADFVIVNGENSADGNGITQQSAQQLLEMGTDVITTGNHCFRRRCQSIYENPRILRPANYPEGTEGSGIFTADLGRTQITVINLMGTAYMEPLDNPFAVADALLAQTESKIILVDFHAEATSEKRAMGFYLAGRVSAVVGTHTHVQTADSELLEGTTAYITDLGMTGPMRSVLGVVPELAVQKLRMHTPVTFQEAQGDCMINGACITVDDRTGRATDITAVFLRKV